jgi:hypothetical protein
MATADDISLVFDALRRIPERGFFTKERAQRDVAEEVGYQLLVHPDWIRPHVRELVSEGVAAAMGFEWQCLLMDDVPADHLAELIARMKSDDSSRLATDLLLASRQPEALFAVAERAARDPQAARESRDLGFDANPAGTLVPRFTIDRMALRLLPETTVRGSLHAVGLPLVEVVAPGEGGIAFHYLSVTPSAMAGLPPWQGRAHIVAPRHWPDWTLHGEPDDQGRLRVVALDLGTDRSLDEELIDKLDAAAEADQVSAAVELAAFDDALTYANQHPLLTPNVIGVVGGPPMGLAPAPSCASCGRVMFHIGWTDTHSREYGDGFRSLFICEDCRTSATLATLWN